MAEAPELPEDSSNAIAVALQKQAEAIQILSKELSALREQLSAKEPERNGDASSIPTSPWDRSKSLQASINDCDNSMLWSLAQPQLTKFSDLLSGRRIWLSTGYRLAYPVLLRFVTQATLEEATRSKVLLMKNSSKMWTSSSGLLNLRSFYAALSRRSDVDPGPGTSAKANCRTILVTDMSPGVAAILLESTPGIDLAAVAPALDRHLLRANFGHVNIYHYGAKEFEGLNSYTLEYHFATFYVPTVREAREKVFRDFRKLRRSSRFGPDVKGPNRWIHEEQLSIILTGHGADVYTCYQLVDRFFSDPTKSDPVFQVPVFSAPTEGMAPPELFLYWISRALNHVARRWDLAISAIDSHIDETFQIVFSETNPDLLSDDPQFTRSKTYFWALQAYKLFDETLSATLENWETFRVRHIQKLHQTQSDQQWRSTVQQIEWSVTRLRDQRDHIRKKVEEVQNLRAGLFGASALFDSRTSLRQNENLRLLTYITLLFLPLSFGTSIFGMQVVLPNLPIKVLIITLPSIFVFTAFLVFNLQTMMDWWENSSAEITAGLRKAMHSYGHPGWPATSTALEHDQLMLQVPIKKIHRKSTHWAYITFLLEAPFVLLPVHEISWLITKLTEISRREQKRPQHRSSHASAEKGTSRATRLKIMEAATRGDVRKRKVLRRPLRFVDVLLIIARTIAMPIWLVLGILDYLVLLIYYSVARAVSEKPTNEEDEDRLSVFLRPAVWLRLDKALIEAGWSSKLGVDREQDKDGSLAAKKWLDSTNRKMSVYKVT